RHGSAESVQQILAPAYGAVGGLEHRGSADGQSNAQEQSQRENERPIRAHRILRWQRGLEEREALALAIGLQVLRNLSLHLFRTNLAIFELCAVVVTHQLPIRLLDLRGHRDLVLMGRALSFG